LHQAQAQQSLWQFNSQFDQGIENLVARGQRAAAGQIAQARALQMQIFGPQLLRAWHQSGLDQVMSFDQFSYQMLITANGTDIAGGVRAMRERFLGQQGAHETLQGANDIYRRGMQDFSQRRIRAVENWDNQAMRGQGDYVDAYGNAVMLPNYAPRQRHQAQNGSIYTQGTDGYWRDRNGYFLTPR
jgi:hypothetical protein